MHNSIAIQGLKDYKGMPTPIMGMPVTQYFISDRVFLGYISKVSKETKKQECQDGTFVEVPKWFEIENDGFTTRYQWYRGVWVIKKEELVFTDEFVKKHFKLGSNFTTRRDDFIANGGEIESENGVFKIKNIVKGFSRKKTSYDKMNIVLNVEDNYRDPHF